MARGPAATGSTIAMSDERRVGGDPDEEPFRTARHDAPRRAVAARGGSRGDRRRRRLDGRHARGGRRSRGLARGSFVRRRGRGPPAARNLGAGRASGEWVGFVDDDDVWGPEIARQLAAADAADRGWVYVGAVAVGERLEIVSGDPPPSPEADGRPPALKSRPGGGSNVILRRDLFEGLEASTNASLLARTGSCGPDSPGTGRPLRCPNR